MSLEPISSITARKFGSRVGDTPVFVEATVTENLDLLSGDSVVSVSIDALTTMKDGQMIATKSLSVEEFRRLVQSVRRQEQVIL